MRISLLLTGTELMTGDIVDSNSAMLAELLLDEGLSVAYKATIPDNMDLLVAEIQRLSADSDVLIVNGGLGPTQDDLTAEALAKVLSRPVELHEAALSHLETWCQLRNYELSEENRKQAMLPKDIELVPNPVGSAVGFKANYQNCLIICTPGVPFELKKMLQASILPGLVATQLQNGSVSSVRRLCYQVFGYGESALQKLLRKSFPDWPAEIDLGFRASIPMIELKLTTGLSDDASLLQEWGSKVEDLLGLHIVSTNKCSLAESLVSLLSQQGKTATTAESCTGGKIASLITEVSGASAVFEAGIVSYSNAIKHQVLGVSEQSLAQHGAVSEAVVRQMLAGALSLSGADIGVAVSGIAGPNGGTSEKPVGTVWVAWGSKESIKAHCFYIPGNRLFFQQLVSAIGLDLMRRELLDTTEEPVYFRSRSRDR